MPPFKNNFSKGESISRIEEKFGKDRKTVREYVLQETYRLLKPCGYLALATDCLAEPVPFPARLRLIAQNL